MKKNTAPRPIENILALFEANTSENGSTRFSNELSSSIRKDGDQSQKNSRLKGALKEKIEVFEKGTSLRESMRFPQTSYRDLDTLQFEDLPSRKSSLMGGYQLSSSKVLHLTAHELEALQFEKLLSRKTSLIESFASTGKSTTHRVVARISRKARCRRNYLERRASTGRVRFGQDQKVWECTDEYATQLNQEAESHDSSERSSRPGLQRRHSTGCLGELTQPTSEFWHTYEQDDEEAPQQSMKKKFKRRRTVRFAQHVTVWVFSKIIRDAKDKRLPHTFKQQTSKDATVPMTENRKKQMSEDRFSSKNVESKSQAPPNMPSRGGQRIHHTSSFSYHAPHFPTKHPTAREAAAAPPKQPKRQLTQRNLTSTPESVQLPPPKQSQRQPTDHNLTDSSSQPQLQEKDPPRPTQSQPTERNLTSAPKLPKRLKSARQLQESPAPPSKPQRESTLRKASDPPKQPQRVSTAHHAPISDGAFMQPLSESKVSSTSLEDDLIKSFHESRGSKASSKGTMLYDSFCDYTEVSEATLDSSDVESISSDMFSVEEEPVVVPTKYVSKITKPSNNSEDSDDIRRERVLMWFRRWAMPSYEMMKRHVRTTPGLGISVEDVDLLPWSTTNATYKI